MTAVLPLYNRAKIDFDYGAGVYLFAKDGRRYLDFASGIAVNAFGYCHPKLVAALTEQANKIWHLSNLYQIPGLESLADKITNISGMDKAFFCNSGAEAVECGIKIVRRYHKHNGNPHKFRIITFRGSFHGRTLAAASASDRDKGVVGFEPAVEGFDNIDPFDIELLKRTINDDSAAILIEPLQGEGGIRVMTLEFMQEIRKICDQHDMLLFTDEIQCGMGRTGKYFCFEWSNIKPDIISVAKGIGGGFPLGACLSTDQASAGMTYGLHGSTYGGNPLAMAVGNAVLDLMMEDKFLLHINDIATYLWEKLEQLQQKFPDKIELIRGKGLMIGVKTVEDSKIWVEKLRDNGLLTVAAADNIIRILPPLIIEKEHVDEAIKLMEQVFVKKI